MKEGKRKRFEETKERVSLEEGKERKSMEKRKERDQWRRKRIEGWIRKRSGNIHSSLINCRYCNARQCVTCRDAPEKNGGSNQVLVIRRYLSLDYVFSSYRHLVIVLCT